MENIFVSPLPGTYVTTETIHDKGCTDSLRNVANSFHTDMDDRPKTLQCILWPRKFRILRVYATHILHPT